MRSGLDVEDRVSLSQRKLPWANLFPAAVRQYNLKLSRVCPLRSGSRDGRAAKHLL